MGRILKGTLENSDLQWLATILAMAVILVILAYVFERIHAGGEERKQESRWMKTIAENVMDLILIVDEKGRVQYITPSITRFLQYRDRDLKGKAVLEYIHPKDQSLVRENFKSGMENRGKMEGRFLHKEGYYVYLSAKVKHLYDEIGNVTGAVISCQDITERKRMENRLMNLRFKDVVTGLHNRGYFEEKVPKYLVKESYPLSIIVGDIDDLKKVNDNYGHLRGDEMLGFIGKVLRDNCRKEDLVCRMGGDEFIMLLPRTTEAEVKKVTERIEKDVSELSCKDINCGISLGNYTAKEPVECVEEIMEIADRNMYQRKEERKRAV